MMEVSGIQGEAAGRVVWNPRKDPVVNVGGCTKFKQKCTKSKISQKENKNQLKF
jgi:hypothetical protein